MRNWMKQGKAVAIPVFPGQHLLQCPGSESDPEPGLSPRSLISAISLTLTTDLLVKFWWPHFRERQRGSERSRITQKPKVTQLLRKDSDGETLPTKLKKARGLGSVPRRESADTTHLSEAMPHSQGKEATACYFWPTDPIPLNLHPRKVPSLLPLEGTCGQRPAWVPQLASCSSSQEWKILLLQHRQNPQSLQGLRH